MHLLEIIHLTLLSTAKAVFDSAFLLIIILIAYMIKKTQNLNIYGYKIPYNSFTQLIESVLQGIIIGVVGSAIIAIIGLPIRITTPILFLLPIAIISAFIHPRFLCFSYSASILSLLSIIFSGQNILGYTIPNLDIDVNGLIVLVGVLHLMEAILIFFVGGKNPIPIITKKNNKIVMGHMLQKFWPIPFSLLALNIGEISGSIIKMPSWWPLIKPVIDSNASYYFVLLPIIGALGYRTVTFAYRPEIKAKISSVRLLVYSVILIILAVISVDNGILRVIAILFMALAHEGIIQYDHFIETVKKPLYGVPRKGIRVLSVHPDGIAQRLGIKVGDIIHNINGFEIENSKDYKTVMQDSYKSFYIEVECEEGYKDKLTYNTFIKEKNLGLNYLPENPKIVFKYNTLNDFKLIRIILKKLNKKI
ncbi:hypothetical protein EDC18_1066 [Natranaerovirga pectinivora]|uniref:PDZ domain-containing protein n=1 Tax=Natranaerovirga pectinivora TaxID=682400 RepID=A0A4R3MJC1_9FIRM|nr:PDZ domain-containing protein [Natranaerovirga pectinivora]TCT14210.1 hypothetical protein EDC18_1066 [Natranaerovirga pectinivora]